MECDRQLHHPLNMASQCRAGGHWAPDIFENLMSVEKMAGVEKLKAMVELLAVIVIVIAIVMFNHLFS